MPTNSKINDSCEPINKEMVAVLGQFVLSQMMAAQDDLDGCIPLHGVGQADDLPNLKMSIRQMQEKLTNQLAEIENRKVK